MRPLRTYRVSALILRIRQLGEADRLLTLLSPERGKIAALAKGARRPRSKLASLQLFSVASLQLAQGKSLDIITQAVVHLPFLTLREDVARFAHASYFVELADAFTEPAQKNRRLFELTVSALSTLERGAAPEMTARAFELRLLDLSGYGPELEKCVSCGRPLPGEPMGFSPSQGGAFCSACRANEQGVMPLHEETRQCLQRFRRLRNLLALPAENISLSPAARKEMLRLLQAQIDYNLGRRIKSQSLLERLAQRVHS